MQCPSLGDYNNDAGSNSVTPPSWLVKAMVCSSIDHENPYRSFVCTAMPNSRYPELIKPCEWSHSHESRQDTRWAHSNGCLEPCDQRQWVRRACPSFAFSSLPMEIRTMIWQSAIQPRLVFLKELSTRPEDFALPAVARVDRESKRICEPSFDRIPSGPCLQFSKDIFVCDPTIADHKPGKIIEELAPHVQRLALWDCLQDEPVMDSAARYEDSLWHTFGRKIAEPLDFSKLWFPALRDLWVIKIEDVDESWRIKRDKNASRQDQLRQLAQQFRYWAKDNILEMAPLVIPDSDTKYLLREGHCSERHCRKSNSLRPMMVSRVMIMNTSYGARGSAESDQWVRIEPRKSDNRPCQAETDAEARRLRWAMVERVLLFMLRPGCSGPKDFLDETGMEESDYD